MDILERISTYIGEEISGTPTGISTGTTTGDVAKLQTRNNIINKKKKKSDDDDSEESVKSKSKPVKSGSVAVSTVAPR